MVDWIFSLYIKEMVNKSNLKKEDYYLKDSKMVFTDIYHLKRGYCCGSGCKHCPYK